MLASELRLQLELLIGQVSVEGGLDPDAVHALLAELPAAVAGADRAEVEALQSTVQALQAAAGAERQRIGEALDAVQKGRKGNRGYGSLKADRKNQRLYRKA